MTPTTYQKPEIRDANDNIIQQGAFGKNTALANATNDGWIDYVANDLEFLYDLAKDEVVPVASLPASGDMNKTYLLTTNGKTYRWSGTEWIELTNSEAVGRAETAASLAEQWATKTDGTVADNEYSAKYYANAAQQSADDAQDVADDMADHLAQIDQNTGGVSANSKRIGNIEKLLQGNLYDYDTDDDTAYTKSVPSGAMPYAGLEQISGKTVVMNQLVRNGNFADTSNWVALLGATFTVSNNVATITAAESANSGIGTVNFALTNGHKYYKSVDVKSSLVVKTDISGLGEMNSTGSGDWEHLSNIINWEGSTGNFTYRIRRKTNGDASATIDAKNALVIDLTLMFGAGNEPSTVAEFEAMFPASYYPYNAGTLLSAGVTSVVSKDSNDTTLQTFPIPAEVQAIEGYGWSAGSVYNYVDFERKVFVQNVGSVDLGTLTWTITGAGNFNSVIGTMVSLSILVQHILLPMYTWKMGASTDEGVYWAGNINLYVRDTSYATANDFKTAMSGVYAYYQLATPIETDISAYLTDDNLIEVEAGGTLTFPNSNGADYQIPVPSEETYMIDLQSALGG